MLTITKARINSISIEWNDGHPKITGSYSMISDKDVTVTTQTFNGYSDRKIEFTKEVMMLTQELLGCVADDIEMDVGIKDIVNTAVKELKGGK